MRPQLGRLWRAYTAFTLSVSIDFVPGGIELPQVLNVRRLRCTRDWAFDKQINTTQTLACYKQLTLAISLRFISSRCSTAADDG